jgi:outer membrane protein OmpA-like peptidoglycan-associated protein
MHTIRFALMLRAASMLLVATACAAQAHPKDVKGASDHPLFTNRMPEFYISSYLQQEFAAFKFGTRPIAEVEGKYTRINYYLNDPAKHPGGLAVRRNYEDAIKAVGGEVVFTNANYSVMKVTRDGVETWVQVQAGTNRYVYMNIVERTAMVQVIAADAMATALARDGFIALDIHFDTGKADILPESMPMIDEIVTLMQSQAALKVSVEGHTDTTGSADDNTTLSDARAQAVMGAIVTKGVDGARLSAVGHGQDRPIADNRTTEGRASNRRVELVKQ